MSLPLSLRKQTEFLFSVNQMNALLPPEKDMTVWSTTQMLELQAWAQELHGTRYLCGLHRIF